jgi:hypothetical protein
MTGQGLSHGWAGEGIGLPAGEPGPPTHNEFFPTKGLYYRQILLSFVSCLGGWSQTIPPVKKLDVLDWRGPMWSSVVKPVGLPSSLKRHWEVAYSREMNIELYGIISGGHCCSQHANCTLPLNLRCIWHCCVTQLHIFICPLLSPAQSASV